MTKTDRSILKLRIDGYVANVRSHVQFSMGGVSLNQVNCEIICRMLESWLFLIEDLMVRQSFSDTAKVHRMENFLHAVTSADFRDTLVVLETVYMLLLRSCNTPVTDFKHQCLVDVSDDYPLGQLLSPVNGVIFRFLNESDKVQQAYFLRDIAQFCRYPRKCSLRSIGLEDTALQDYLRIEEEVAAIDLDDQEETVSSLSRIVKEWFIDFRIDELLPSHGPGSVAEGPLTLSKKFDALATCGTVRYLLNNGRHPTRYEGFYPHPVAQTFEKVSRTIFVPKTATKLRTISMEPASLQYIQQGVMFALYRYIENHPIMGDHIKLRDQTQNQLEACEGSLYGTKGTIDLSHASDSVSLDLVRRVFRSVPHLYKWLIGTRSSRSLLPDGKTIVLNKFAPMGSALCFPIECILFSAIVEHASRMDDRRTSRFKPRWFVYGDDIVVPSHYYSRVSTILESLGFTVNTTKSYNSGPYRESCGKEYYNGVDITPLYYRTPFYKSRISPSAFGSWCSSANNAAIHRLPLLRWHLISKCRSVSSRLGIYFTHNEFNSPKIGSTSATNFHVKARWSKRYQRLEGRFISVLSKPRESEVADDNYRYFCCLVDMAKRDLISSTHIDESLSPRAMSGSVEKFSSATLPINPFLDTQWYPELIWQST